MNEMKIKPVTLYETPDGEQFKTEDEAHAHIATANTRALAARFATHHGADDGEEPSVRAVNRRVNLIVAWETWKSGEASE